MKTAFNIFLVIAMCIDCLALTIKAVDWETQLVRQWAEDMRVYSK